MTDIIQQAQAIIQKGGIIAYPTEAVYGLGCDPFNEIAIERLLQLKGRPRSKGLIIIGAHWQQLEPLTQAIPQERLATIMASWPGPHTWIFPASEKVPAWISGEFDSIALRVTAHPIARALCENAPLVSTSANPLNQTPACNTVTLKTYFPQGIDLVIAGLLGDSVQPTTIRHAITGDVVRA